jgi:hypothetical protein
MDQGGGGHCFWLCGLVRVEFPDFLDLFIDESGNIGHVEVELVDELVEC